MFANAATGPEVHAGVCVGWLRAYVECARVSTHSLDTPLLSQCPSLSFSTCTHCPLPLERQQLCCFPVLSLIHSLSPYLLSLTRCALSSHSLAAPYPCLIARARSGSHRRRSRCRENTRAARCRRHSHSVACDTYRTQPAGGEGGGGERFNQRS